MSELVKMKDNLIIRYQQCKEFDYRNSTHEPHLKNELIAQRKCFGWNDYFATKQFLKSIEGKEIEIIRTYGDAFEINDNNYWLPDELFEVIK